MNYLRLLVIAVLGLVLAMAAAACGDDDDSSDGASGPAPGSTASSQTTPAPSATAATAQAETRVIEDLFGEVEIPANPQSVVAAESITLGNMLALGVKPVATGVNVNSLPGYLQDQMAGVEDITTEDDIDMERALALGADLIISVGGEAEDPWNQEYCELYAEAVPTFCYEYGYTYEEQIKKNLTEVARALGLEAKGEQVLADFDARVADLGQKVIDAGFTDKPVTVIRVRQDGTYSIRIGTSESIIFRAIGIPQPEGQQNPDDFALDVSLENLDILNQAYAVLIYIDDNASVTQEELLGGDVWQTLTPVQEGRVAFINSGIWNSADILGAFAIMDDIETLLLPLAGG